VHFCNVYSFCNGVFNRNSAAGYGAEILEIIGCVGISYKNKCFPRIYDAFYVQVDFPLGFRAMKIIFQNSALRLFYVT
jgi:hypothetical protein